MLNSKTKPNCLRRIAESTKKGKHAHMRNGALDTTRILNFARNTSKGCETYALHPSTARDGEKDTAMILNFVRRTYEDIERDTPMILNSVNNSVVKPQSNGWSPNQHLNKILRHIDSKSTRTPSVPGKRTVKELNIDG